jgi:hypothetical protein
MHAVSFRPKGQIERDIQARSGDGEKSPSSVAETAVGRYFEALRRSLPTFTEAEATLLVSVLNGARHGDPVSIGYLWAEIADDHGEATLEFGESSDGVAFSQRLRALSFIECVAIVDAVERFWLGSYHQEGPIGPKLREVGLI